MNRIAQLTVFGALVGASLFAVPTIASADAVEVVYTTPDGTPVRVGPGDCFKNGIVQGHMDSERRCHYDDSVPTGAASSSLTSSATPSVITPVGTVLRSDGVCHSDSVCTPSGTVVRSTGVCQSGAVCSPLGTVMVSDGMGGQVPSTAYYSD